MEQVESATGIAPDELIGPEFPDAVAGLWSVWLDLQDARAPAVSGVAALTYSEIDAYTRLTGVQMPAWQVDALRRLDRLFRRIVSE